MISCAVGCPGLQQEQHVKNRATIGLKGFQHQTLRQPPAAALRCGKLVALLCTWRLLELDSSVTA
jgi:hypothetical protein